MQARSSFPASSFASGCPGRCPRGLLEAARQAPVARECADVSCVETLHVQMQEYLAVREHPRQFVVLRDHVFPHVERVVSGTDGYVVVEKTLAVSAITEATDPKA